MAKETYPRTVHGSELRIGDRIRLNSMEEWNTAIVKFIDEEDGHRFLRLFRPYGLTSGFCCAGGTICYVGIEDFSCGMDAPFTLLSREEMR